MEFFSLLRSRLESPIIRRNWVLVGLLCSLLVVIPLMSLLFYRINRLDYQLRQHDDIHDQLLLQLSELSTVLKARVDGGGA
mmetsp:Transcript_20809/g.32477  ORF Transcript_20809/g.32477 Transcript_20809/m.32477 type:complete len:81 (+) Transcript_20809:142-384(+)